MQAFLSFMFIMSLYCSVFVIGGPMLMLEACSDGEMFGRGCEMADDYGEAYMVAAFAWIMGSIPLGIFVMFLYTLGRSIYEAYQKRKVEKEIEKNKPKYSWEE